VDSGDYSLVKQAYSAYAESRYGDAIVILENSALRSGNSYMLFLLSVCYLHEDKIGKAESIIRKLKLSDPAYVPVQYLEAFLVMKSAGDRESAMYRYIELLQKFPSDRVLKKSFKRIQAAKDFPAFQREARLRDFVPVPKPKRVRIASKRVSVKHKANRKFIYLPLLVMFIVLMIVPGILYHHDIMQYITSIVKSIGISTKEHTQHGKDVMDMVTLDGAHYDIIEKYNREKTSEFYYSSESLKRDFNRAKEMIKSGHYNEALVILNRINASNVHHRVKDRIAFLRNFVLDIDDRPVSGYTFERLIEKPHLYRGVKIQWKGKVANLKKKNDHIVCNLLIDYKNSHRFSGVAELYAKQYPGTIENGNMVETVATFVNTMGEDNRIYLVAENITIISE